MNDTLLEFPVRFPIKMMGRDAPEFRQAAIDLIESHVGKVGNDEIRVSPSRKGNFVSITITINATSQEQLDDIYRDLSAHEDILVAL